MSCITILLIISGMAVVIGLGLARYRLEVSLPAPTDALLEKIVKFIVLILVPANTVLSTLIIHREGIKGMQLVILQSAGMLLSAGLFVWLYLAKILGAMGPFGLDLVIRAILVALFIVAFFFFTPLDVITSIISSTFSKEK